MDRLMEVDRATDGLIAARRCLAAMSETQDIETRYALWRAAGRYMAKYRERLPRLEIRQTLPHAPQAGEPREDAAREAVEG